jgi:DedD protein
VNDILKQRLVGALILVALGVIFWPIIFVQPEGDDTPEPRPIPAPPGISMESVEPPDEAGLRPSPTVRAVAEGEGEARQEIDVIAEAPPAGETPAAAPVVEPPPEVAPPTPRTRSESPQRLAMDSDGVPIAWTLQVATLSSADKADALRQRLLAAGQKAYIANVQRDGRTLYRVCIGPKFERAELERIKPQVDSAFGVKSLVARYVP